MRECSGVCIGSLYYNGDAFQFDITFDKTVNLLGKLNRNYKRTKGLVETYKRRLPFDSLPLPEWWLATPFFSGAHEALKTAFARRWRRQTDPSWRPTTFYRAACR